MKKILFLALFFLSVLGAEAQDAVALFDAGTDKFMEGNALGAIKDITAAIHLDSNYAEAYLGRGSIYAEIEQYDLALEDLNRAITLDPTAAEAFFNRAVVYIALDQAELALRDLNLYIVMKPKDMSGYLARIDILVDFNEQVKVYQDCETIMKLSAVSAEEFFHRGRIKVLMMDTVGGLSDFDSALMIEPTFMSVYIERATAYYHSGRYDKAIQDLNIYLLNYEHDWQAYEMRGECYGRQSEYSFAIDDYNRSLQYNNKNADAYFNRGYFQMKMERYEEAITDFKKAILFGYKDARYLYFNKANSEYSIGHKEQACKDWEKAGELGLENKNKFCN